MVCKTAHASFFGHIHNIFSYLFQVNKRRGFQLKFLPKLVVNRRFDALNREPFMFLLATVNIRITLLIDSEAGVIQLMTFDS